MPLEETQDLLMKSFAFRNTVLNQPRENDGKYAYVNVHCTKCVFHTNQIENKSDSELF